MAAKLLKLFDWKIFSSVVNGIYYICSVIQKRRQYLCFLYFMCFLASFAGKGGMNRPGFTGDCFV